MHLLFKQLTYIHISIIMLLFPICHASNHALNVGKKVKVCITG